MQGLNPGGVAIRILAPLVVLGAVGLGATSMARLPPSPSAHSRALDTQVVDHIPGGGPDGGAVHDLAIVATRPATVFAAFEQGGVFRSLDRGATWTPADRGLPDDASCDLVAAPTHSSTLYAACGDGLFKTTNGGALWRQLDIDNPRPPVVAPSDPRVVYQPPEYGVVRSQDGGRHWEQIHGSIPTQCAAAFAIDPTDSLVLFCADERWMKVSRDGGLTWTLPDGPPHPDVEIAALAIDPSDRNRMLAGTSDGHVLKTTDGASWYSAADGPAVGAIDHLEFVGESGDVVFARQGSSILRSLDGGDQWQILPFAGPDGPVGPFAVDPVSPSTIHVATRQGVMVTTDFGKHWALRHRGIARATAFIVLHEATPSTLYASSGREFFTSHDGGNTWTTFRPDGAIAEMEIVSLASDGASGVVARTAAGTYWLRRGESTWAPFASPPGSHPAPTWDTSADRPSLFATTTDGFVFSVDGGRHWRAGRLPSNQIPSGIVIAAGEPRVLYASTGGILSGLLGQSGIWRTLDDGATWQLVDEPLSNGIGWCCGLVADPNHRDTIYVTVGGVGIGGEGVLVRRTTDGGLTWAELRLPGLALSLTASPTMPTTLLAQIYDVTDAGRFVLMASRDRGDHWIRTGAGLPPNVQVTNIVMDTRRPTRLFAGTNGRGVFRSLDGGATWQPTGPLR